MVTIGNHLGTVFRWDAMLQNLLAYYKKDAIFILIE